ncbi:hypothetical protein [Streptomyces sp. CC77]|uniref:hypothetical protein n=1 Tax=Streptomyces sp. CC77 TaxID=1906739 RepID=UPI0008DDBAE6|nr:hypothetical protein [Streptomyces sp. CC77]OII68182.1 hypothetical protein BJP39_05705 [Streptomyces sp. CC77]
MTPTVYTIEMAYAQMRYLQEQASRSRVSSFAPSERVVRRETPVWEEAGATGCRARRARGRKH